MNNYPSDREGVFESLKTITGYIPNANTVTTAHYKDMGPWMKG